VEEGLIDDSARSFRSHSLWSLDAIAWRFRLAIVGLNANRGSLGYFIEMQGKLQFSVLEKLIKYEIAAK
jgi:hypothetical protein